MKSDQAYIRVIGNIKSYNDKRYINATRLRVCKDQNEPYFHILEIMTTKLFYERGHVRDRIVPPINITDAWSIH